MIGEYDVNGNALQETVYLDDLPVAVIKPETNPTINLDVNAANTLVTGNWTTQTIAGKTVRVSAPTAGNTSSADPANSVDRANAANPSNPNRFTWRVNLPSVNFYNVYARWPASANNSTAAQYTISSTPPTQVTVNQQQNDNQWVFLATLPLGGQTDTITLSSKVSANASATVVADAIRIVPMNLTNLYYVYSDHINTPRAITRSADNKLVWSWEHADPFGAIPPNEDPSGLGRFTYNRRMPGQTFDAETGFFDNWHRSYWAEGGRYRSPDPIGLAGGMNPYNYVGGNPVMFTDSEGLMGSRGRAGPIPSTGWGNAVSMTFSWVTGTGPSHFEFGPASIAVGEMMNAPGVKAARQFYEKKNQNCNCENAQPVTNFAAGFGLSGLWKAGLNPTQQFVGSYSVEIQPLPNCKKKIILKNTSSFKSFAYGIGPDWDRSTFGPMGNMSQTYWWIE